MLCRHTSWRKTSLNWRCFSLNCLIVRYIKVSFTTMFFSPLVMKPDRSNWRQIILTYLELLSTVQTARNTGCFAAYRLPPYSRLLPEQLMATGLFIYLTLYWISFKVTARSSGNPLFDIPYIHDLSISWPPFFPGPKKKKGKNPRPVYYPADEKLTSIYLKTWTHYERFCLVADVIYNYEYSFLNWFVQREVWIRVCDGVWCTAYDIVWSIS